MTPAAPLLPRPGHALLTDADRAMLLMLADGLTLKQAAARLGTSPSAVGTRLSRLYAETGTSNGTHLVATALRHGWLDGDTPQATATRRQALLADLDQYQARNGRAYRNPRAHTDRSSEGAAA